MKKRILIISLSVIILCSLAAVIYQVSFGSHQFRKVNPAFKAYISAFTTGVIPTDATIKVRLTHDYADSVLFNTVITDALFSFSPSIAGKAYWLDSRTVEFRPDKRLPSKVFYEAEFSLSKLMKVPDSLETLEFQFQTMSQDFEVKVENHKAYNKDNLAKEKLFGTLKTADVADDADIEKLLTATQNDKTLSIKWVHDAKKKTHYFTVDSIIRGKTTSWVMLAWNGSAIDAATTGEKKVEIPGLDVFKVSDVALMQGAEQYIRVLFSCPLLEEQNLAGLIRLGDNMDLRYAIEDNELRIYTNDRKDGTATLTLEASIQDWECKPLDSTITRNIVFESTKPAVRFIGTGVIMPTSNGFLLPFEAANLRAVDIKITKIYEDNILQFLQVNDLSGSYELARVGKTVLKKSMLLSKVVDYNKWNRFYLDLSDYIKTEPGAMYTVKLGFKKSYSTFPCEDEEVGDDEVELTTWEGELGVDDDDWYYDNSYYYSYYDDDGYYYYDWNNRNNPCSMAYYNNVSVTRNVLASDLGIVAKASPTTKTINVYVTDIVTTKPIENAEVKFYDYQQQLIGSARSNSLGMAECTLKKKPFVLVVEKDKQRGYLKLQDGSTLSLSMFDVDGEMVQKGLKGFIYGERGVWRPGDSLYLTFILEDKEKTLPENHPVTFSLYDPNGQLSKQIIKTTSVNNFYDFRCSTERSSPTGNWLAKVKVGGVEFTKTLKIETVKPNRLKINLSFGKDYIAKDDGSVGTLSVRWLTGATARKLRSTVNLTLSRSITTFAKYPGYTFDNPSSGFTSQNISVFDGKLDDKGQATFTPDINISSAAPGLLKAYFETTVFESGGDFSTDRSSVMYYPYQTYAGIYVPLSNTDDRMLYTDKTYNLNLVNLDYKGNIVPTNKLKIEVYKMSWNWWWDNSAYDNQADFVSTSYSKLVDSMTVSTISGKASYPFSASYNNWGRYLIKVTDKTSGHSAGKIVYVDWSEYAHASGGEKTAATMLTFTADKDTFKVGDKAKLTIPTAADGRALLTLETGTKIIKSVWIETDKDKTEFTFDITAEMAPNCYAYVTLIQPHSQTMNDLPIRLYGVIPIIVEDPNSHLKPVITMKDVLLPEADAYVTVTEQTGKPMTYTLAMVDEGLLDLTRFKTPDPWSVFYAREALGVKTWDLFDMVMGAFTGDLERILSIGGDGAAMDKGALKANRFKPMVRFIGPFQLKAGESKTHTIKIPQYIGSVRVMVVAGDKGKYGCAEKTVAVRKPLMVLSTIPRVIGPGETMQLPVNVFAMENYIKNVTVKIIADNMFTVSGATTQSMYFKAVGDSIANFTLEAKEVIGVGKIKVIATCGTLVATEDLEIDIRNPNPKVVNVIDTVIQPGATWTSNYKLPGMAGTNKGVLEITSIPPLNLEKRLNYLIEYPHGCIEQTTSAAFPQLYLSDLMDLAPTTKAKVEANIKAAVKLIKTFQLSNGGLGYWSGSSYADDWGTNYAGHFMLEAELKGYTLPVGFLKSWKKFQKKKATSWTYNATYYNDDLVQAYRLYTLALAKAPELGAMNKLYASAKLTTAARWRLAAAYQLAGKPEISKALVLNTSTYIKPYRELWYTYGSDLRDKAMIIEALCLLDQKTKAATLVKELSKSLSQDEWMSTQTTAYSLLAITKYIGTTSATTGVNISYSLNGGAATAVTSKKSIVKADLGITAASTKGTVVVTNSGKNLLYARIITQGIPLKGDKTTAENKLKIKVEYKTIEGKKIDPKKLEQGTNFIVEATVINPGTYGIYKQLALIQIFPSGWEIQNARMSDYASVATQTGSYYDYQDIRDDRVYTYFELYPNKMKTFKIMLNSSYLGEFYLPTLYCEAMYDNTINARVPGTWVDVVASKE